MFFFIVLAPSPLSLRFVWSLVSVFLYCGPWLFISRGGKLSFLEGLRCFWRVLKNLIAGPSSNSSIGMENNDELYGFCAVKVKFVDSLI